MTAPALELPSWVRPPMSPSTPPLLVTTVPPPDAAAGDWPVDGDAARRLLGCARLKVPGWLKPRTPGEALAAYCESKSLWPEYVEKRPAWEARARANALPCTGRLVILLGREAERAFSERMDTEGHAKAQFYTWCAPLLTDDAQCYLVLPHPSPLNRMYYRREDRELAGSAFRRAVEVWE